MGKMVTGFIFLIVGIFFWTIAGYKFFYPDPLWVKDVQLHNQAIFLFFIMGLLYEIIAVIHIREGARYSKRG